MSSAPLPQVGAPRYAVVGRYAVFDEIASGGMAAVHLGRLLGAAGFSRTVAIKRLHPQFARDEEFATMFMDEARLASRIQHLNVVQTLDVVPIEKEILLVMEYVHGVPLAALLGASRRAGKRLHPRIVAGVMAGVLEGLHAAHEVRNELGVPLDVVHRDVSPQNVLLGLDGTPRVIDFGVAKALGKMHATREGQLKGKLAYMSPEQVRGVDVTRLSDVFSASIVLWEALTFERLFNGSNPAELILRVLDAPIASPRSKFPDLPLALDVVVMKGLSRDPAARYATAREMAVALEAAVGGLSSSREIGAWVASLAGDTLATRAKLLESIEQAVSATSSSGENTRIQGLRALLDARSQDGARELLLEQGSFLDSGPRPKEAPTPMPVGLPSSPPPTMGGEMFGNDLTMPGHLSDASPPSVPVPGPPLPVAPPPAKPTPLSVAPPAAKPMTLPITPPLSQDEAPLFDPSPARPRRAPRQIQPAQTEGLDRASLRERLERPLQLVAAGVALSLVDWAVREYTVALPVRPIWLAEILVVVGVIWAFARLALPSRE